MISTTLCIWNIYSILFVGKNCWQTKYRTNYITMDSKNPTQFCMCLRWLILCVGISKLLLCRAVCWIKLAWSTSPYKPLMHIKFYDACSFRLYKFPSPFNSHFISQLNSMENVSKTHHLKWNQWRSHKVSII